MSVSSTIEWTEATWNPTTGCHKISPGCQNCYAERFAERWRGVPGHPYEQGFDVKSWNERITMPLSWKKPRLIFVNSMSDLFLDEISEEFIKDVFYVMKQAHWHQFQLLTKRPQRMLEISKNIKEWPPNVWAGVSVESQAWLWRSEILKEIPAQIRFLSCEPLLGSLKLCLEDLHWIIVGGESGVGARPMKSEWVRDIREQCIQAHVPFFFKQWGGVQKKKNGRVLDGRTWDEFPMNVNDKSKKQVANFK
ncbi:phage Gp37Gp68 family protein [Tolypothrix tenuis PCC 7101]|uniref:Phage Gp37Gp68 family protein n=1 Tax=Tolypothrix tenuis PCC 7101 TaxID=231146 RepID=A0A1Z4MXP2_9CYAN|nr:phage Gp37/Gp68 family protein [Aulosira sp. FACHB-113]BAY98223.1 phage Gp37Gp68 family protein [Tolypothrix tenuis PCC 7101]BAZ77858.1 phage Gp37Gp68 family protein [Aulosira laxa NIES-50]